MNWIWFSLIVGSVVTAAFTGKMAEVTAASIDSAKSAVTLAIGLVGVMAFWLGMLRIVQVGGFLHTLAPLAPSSHGALVPRRSGRPSRSERHDYEYRLQYAGSGQRGHTLRD